MQKHKKLVLPSTLQKIQKEAFLYSTIEKIEISENSKWVYKKDSCIFTNLTNQCVAEEGSFEQKFVKIYKGNEEIVTLKQKLSESLISKNHSIETYKFWNDIFNNAKSNLIPKNTFFKKQNSPLEQLVSLLNNDRATIIDDTKKTDLQFAFFRPTPYGFEFSFLPLNILIFFEADEIKETKHETKIQGIYDIARSCGFESTNHYYRNDFLQTEVTYYFTYGKTKNNFEITLALNEIDYIMEDSTAFVAELKRLANNMK